MQTVLTTDPERPLWHHSTPLERAHRLVAWIRRTLATPATLATFVAVYLTVTSPTWLGWILYFVTGSAWHLTYANAYATFWALPGTPLIPSCVLLTVGLRKLILHRRKQHEQEEQD